jgi:hypothetical protein
MSKIKKSTIRERAESAPMSDLKFEEIPTNKEPATKKTLTKKSGK